MEVYLVRHTKVALGSEYCYGISDVDLADSHQNDVLKVKEKLHDITFDHAYTSPLSRCKTLSNTLIENAVEEPSLIEMSLGDWELKKWADLDQKTVNDWMNDFVNINPPGSESFMEYSMKPVFFFDKLVKDLNKDDKVLLVSHSGAIRSIICHVLGLTLSHAFNFEVDFGSVSKIEIVDNWYKLKYLNF